MSWRPVIWLSVVVVLIGLFVIIFEQGADPAGRALSADQPLLHLRADGVTRLSLSVGGFSAECVRRDGEWYLVRPAEMRADPAKLARLIEAVLALRKRETIDPGQMEKRRLTMASFGLEAPRARVVIGTELRADEIWIGDAAPLGDQVYMRLNDERNVFGTAGSLMERLPTSLDDLRDRAIFPSSIKRAVRLEVKHSGGFVQLAWKDGLWRIQQPFDARADNARVERLLRSLESLAVEDMGGGAAADPLAYGVGGDESTLQVSIWPEGRKDPLVLTVGKARPDNPVWLYARVSDMGGICSINRDILFVQGLKAESFRDRRLFTGDPGAVASLTLHDGDSKLVLEKTPGDGWMIVEPFRFPANPLSVGAVLRGLSLMQGDEVRTFTATNGVSVEMGALTCGLGVANMVLVPGATNEPGTKGEGWLYRFPPLVVASAAQVYREDSRTLYGVQSNDLVRLWANVTGHSKAGFADPLPYMDCRMLVLKPDQVRRISAARRGREETVTLGNDGVWTVDSPPDGQVTEGAIPALLGLAAELRAERVESVSATNVAMYQLDDSAPRVTFGLSGTNGIRKTILVGGDNGQDGVYAMLQGQDVIFILRRETAGALTKPLVTTP